VSRLAVLLCVFCTERFRETVLTPTLADLQHERGRSRARGSRGGWVLARGIVSVMSASVLYASQMPERHLREMWLAPGAPGPRFLPSTLAMTVLATATWWALSLTGTRSAISFADLSYLGLPTYLLIAGPLAVALAVARVLSGERDAAPQDPPHGRARSALSLAAASSVVLLGVSLYLLPVTNEAWRDAVVSRITQLRRIESAPGSTALAHRQAWIAAAEEAARLRATREPHERFAMPLSCLTLVALALALGRITRGWPLLVGLLVIGVEFRWLLRAAQLEHGAGVLSAALAVWGPQLVLWTCAALVVVAARALRRPALG
jgi:hypothetical protein